MIKILLIFTISFCLTFACAKKNQNIQVEQSKPSEEEIVIGIYKEGVDALKEGDAFFAAKKFKEAESIMPKSEWAAKAALMEGYAQYNRNAYALSIFSLERYIKYYPADINIPYAHYLIATCYYEQILDEKKDLEPLLQAKKKFEFIISNYPNTDYAIDSEFKLDLIVDQLAAKEISIARFYMQNEKWIPAINRLKIIVKKYDTTIFIEEALHRLVEVYYKIGLIEEAKQTALILGYNYESSRWYERSYAVLNKEYEKKKKKNKKSTIRKKIKSLFE
jgi:outer membrane protein assembly factor BamD